MYNSFMGKSVTRVEEVRTHKFPGIAFRGSEGDRRAWLLGTALDVWQIIEAYRAMGSERLLEEGDLSEEEIGLALEYYETHPEEIDEAISINRRSEREWHELYPDVVPPPE